MVGMKTESGDKKGVKCIVYSDVHDGRTKLQTTHNVQSVRQGSKTDGTPYTNYVQILKCDRWVILSKHY